jgi:hypothetical protein
MKPSTPKKPRKAIPIPKTETTRNLTRPKRSITLKLEEERN